MGVGLVALAVVGVLLLILIGVAAWVIGLYNSLVRLKVATESAFSGIDVQLKRRHDLIPNLVETVKGYATHEKGTFEAVTQARAAAMGARSMDDKIAAEGMLSGALGRLMAVAEAYPQLRANENFMQLQGELSDIENRISAARGGYNGSAEGFNSTLQQFPTNIVGGIFGFRAFEFFRAGDGERAAPQVKF
jgi:LemA protein